MQKFKDALREEQKRLEEIIAKAKKENEHMPEGNLRISKHKKQDAIIGQQASSIAIERKNKMQSPVCKHLQVP